MMVKVTNTISLIFNTLHYFFSSLKKENSLSLLLYDSLRRKEKKYGPHAMTVYAMLNNIQKKFFLNNVRGMRKR